MSKFDKLKELSLLFDEYENLLTDIQKKVFKLYFFEDQSLSEISNITNTSRSSISEKIKLIEVSLKKWESKLHLVEKRIKLNKIIDSLDNEKNIELINKLKEI